MATTTTKPTISLPVGNVNSIEVKDYQEVRNDNYNKISNYYNQIFKTYKDKNEIYQRDRANFSDRDARAYAETVLKKQVDDYQNQIFNIYNEMINLLKKNDEIILTQKSDVEKMKKQTDKLDDQIKTLKKKEDSMSTDVSGHESNKAKIDKAIKDEKLKYQIYFGICIFIIVFIVIILAYLVWRPETSITIVTTTNLTNNKATSSNSNNNTNTNNSNINNKQLTNNKNMINNLKITNNNIKTNTPK
jgi:hypothetical protein